MYQIIIITGILLVLLLIMAFTRKKNNTKTNRLRKVNVDEIKSMSTIKSMYGYETVICKKCGQEWDVTKQINQDSEDYICPECRKKS